VANSLVISTFSTKAMLVDEESLQSASIGWMFETPKLWDKGQVGKSK
jgi:hypothetical protein